MSFVISRKGKWELSEAALGQKCERHNGKIIIFQIVDEIRTLGKDLILDELTTAHSILKYRVTVVVFEFARLCLPVGRWEFGRKCLAGGQDDRISKSKSTQPR